MHLLMQRLGLLHFEKKSFVIFDRNPTSQSRTSESQEANQGPPWRIHYSQACREGFQGLKPPFCLIFKPPTWF
jgi:hypothetical protein